MSSFLYAASILASTYVLVSAATPLASAPAPPSGCGLKGYDKSPAYNYLNDTTSANFDQCSARCITDSVCVSFAYGSSECLLYTQTVESNVNEIADSPFTFYDKSCASSPSTISSTVYPSSSSAVFSSQTSSEISTSGGHEQESTASETMLSSKYGSLSSSPYLTASASEARSSSIHEGSPAESEIRTSSESEAYPTSSTTETAHATVTPMYISEVFLEGLETVSSYIDITVTHCPPGVEACSTTPIDGSPASSSPSVSSNSSPSLSSVTAGSAESSSSPDISPHPETGVGPTQDIEAPEGHNTVITTHYIGICPTGYTTISYTTTIATAFGASPTPAITSELPAGFTTTAVFCPACDPASPKITLTVPVVSVVPIPVFTGLMSEVPPSESALGESSSAESSIGESLPAQSSLGEFSPSESSSATSATEDHAIVSPPSEGSPVGDSNQAEYGSTPSAPQTASTDLADYSSAYPTSMQLPASSVTGGLPYSTISGLGYPDVASTVAIPPYNAENATMSFQTAPASAGSQTAGASNLFSGAEATRPLSYTGGAPEVGKHTFAAAIMAAICASSLVG